jgi:hypothetical protein
MGNLLHITQDDGFDRNVLFTLFLDSGGTVRDVVRLGLTCRVARAWVCTMVAALDPPLLCALVESCPAYVSDVDILERYLWIQKVGTPPLIEWWIDEDYAHKRLFDTRRMQPDYAAILFSADPLDDETGGEVHFEDVMYQWYPMLDQSIRHCVARWAVQETSAELAPLDSELRAAKRQRLLY